MLLHGVGLIKHYFLSTRLLIPPYSVAAYIWGRVCAVATSSESHTRAVEFVVTRAATTSDSASTDATARTKSAILVDGIVQRHYLVINRTNYGKAAEASTHLLE